MVRVTAAGVDFVLRERTPTERHLGYEAVLGRAVSFLRETVARAGLDLASVPLGVGMPGGVERRTGLVKNSNTVCLNGRPFREDLCRALGRPVEFDNDANCFALAEALHGAARPHVEGVVFGVIMGTGVGGGIVIDGEVWRGASGVAGEWGHHAVFAGAPDARRCYCGQRGCLERYASGPAVEEAYEALTGARISVADIAARRGRDPAAAQVFDELLSAFARGLANVIDVLDPSAIVVGGGLSHLDELYGDGRDRVARLVFNDELATPILRNALGDSAGVIGAASIGLSAAAPR